ncbi:MAG: MoaD/ThiS family protein [Phycisphaerales bacterium]|nr:MoaD/ThiS family protein [Phycisphaerales bacterium]
MDRYRMLAEVKLFGPAAKAAGADAVRLELTAGATCAELREALVAECPALAHAVSWGRFALNGRFADEDGSICDGDEIALITLVGGG